MKRSHAWSTLLTLCLAACSNGDSRHVGQSEFVSAPPGGSGGSRGGVSDNAGGTPAPASPGGGKTTTTPTRTVQETDLYRLEGNRLYYLNSYRGLMVFDVTNVDAPKLLGRSPIFGTPVDMIVQNGIATVIVGDWYGKNDDGTPFHGSVVRGLDATNPASIKVLGDVKLAGWVQDSRVVGNVLYTVSQDYGWYYGYDDVAVSGGGVATSSTSTQSVIVSSVRFGGGQVQAVSEKKYDGYSGIFYVTPDSILLAHTIQGSDPSVQVPGQTELRYLDISDPNGAVVERGVIDVPGAANGWGADNGRWNLDFADGKTAHVVGCNGSGWGCDGTGYTLSIADFSNPDAPKLASTLDINGQGWTPTSRFDGGRLYLSPDNYSNDGSTPLQIFDVTDPAAPKLSGSTELPGTVWNILPAPNNRLFALGNDWSNSVQSDNVSLSYVDVTDATAPKVIGTSEFGAGWAWTPAAQTFKAFTMDATRGLVVLPFSGWSQDSYQYTDGLQLIEFTDSTQKLAGVAKTKGWVERGIFVQNRLVSLSDLSLSVVDYTNHDAPVTTASLTLARNVVAAQPSGSTIAEVSSDWWYNDTTKSEVRVLPASNADELVDAPGAPTVDVDGVNARVFRNGDLAYVVTDVQVPVDCNTQQPIADGPKGGCYSAVGQVQVVDLSNGTAKLRGKAQLPSVGWGYGGYGWWGFYWYDWYSGSDAVQVGNDALAFRRWQPVYDSSGNYVSSNDELYVVDLSNADAPQLASTTVLSDPHGWWGNMRVVGDTLYTTHYEWVGDWQTQYGQVKYFADRIDLSDRSHPKVKASINVPGLIVGGSDTDPSIIYTVDYRWDNNTELNDFDVLKVHGHTAELLSQTQVPGYIGNVIVQNGHAYFSAQTYDQNTGASSSALHVLDLADPSAPVDHPAAGKNGWGWLLGVQGDRAIMTSGWGYDGIDIYKLDASGAPAYDQFVRTLGWGAGNLTRNGDTLYVITGYWGVQAIPLQ